MKNTLAALFATGFLFHADVSAASSCNRFCQLWQGCRPDESVFSSVCNGYPGPMSNVIRNINYIIDDGGFPSLWKKYRGRPDAYVTLEHLKHNSACATRWKSVSGPVQTIYILTPSCIGRAATR